MTLLLFRDALFGAVVIVCRRKGVFFFVLLVFYVWFPEDFLGGSFKDSSDSWFIGAVVSFNILTRESEPSEPSKHEDVC